MYIPTFTITFVLPFTLVFTFTILIGHQRGHTVLRRGVPVVLRDGGWFHRGTLQVTHPFNTTHTNPFNIVYTPFQYYTHTLSILHMQPVHTVQLAMINKQTIHHCCIIYTCLSSFNMILTIILFVYVCLCCVYCCDCVWGGNVNVGVRLLVARWRLTQEGSVQAPIVG